MEQASEYDAELDEWSSEAEWLIAEFEAMGYVAIAALIDAL